MHEAKFWKKEKHAIRCGLCPHHCLIQEGKTGICRVRINEGGRLFTLSFAQPLAVHVDPIEKKPLYHFYPGELALSIGTAGCNLQCRFCQNWQLSQVGYNHLSNQYLSPDEVVELALENNCKMIAFTYNEPTIFAEYVIEISALAHRSGLSNIMVTNGYISKEVFAEVYQMIDAANVDLKFFTDDSYKNLTGGQLTPVLETLLLMKKHNIWCEITTLVIPGENDNLEDFKKMIRWIRENLGDDVPFHLSAYHPDYQYQDAPPTSAKQLKNMRQIALDSGIKFVYTGNIWHTPGSSTYCPVCGKCVIARTGMQTQKVNLNQSSCSCGTFIPGRFD